MAMTKIDAPEKPQGQDLMDLLLEPAKFRQHLERLEEAHRRLDEKLAAIATLDEAEALRAQASAALAEGNTFREIALTERRDAATFLQRARTLAEKEAREILAAAEAEVGVLRRDLQAQRAAVDERARAVASDETRTVHRETAARSLAEAAERKSADAQRLYARWEQKLAALRALIANE